MPMTCRYFHFQTITSLNINGFSPIFVCVLIFWKIGTEVLMGRFCTVLTELSVRDTSIVSFPDNNLSKSQWIFTKLNMCIDLVEIWFWIDIG